MSAAAVAALVVAVFWAVVTGFLVRLLARMSAVQERTAAALCALAEQLDTDRERSAAPLAGRTPETGEHERQTAARFTVVPSAGHDDDPPRLSRVSVGLRGPAVKVAAFGYGVRRAMTDRNPRELERRAKAEIKADRAARRAHWRRARA